MFGNDTDGHCPNRVWSIQICPFFLISIFVILDVLGHFATDVCTPLDPLPGPPPPGPPPPGPPPPGPPPPGPSSSTLTLGSSISLRGGSLSEKTILPGKLPVA